MTLSQPVLWFVIGAITLGTFALRFSFVGWLSGRDAPPWLNRTLRFIPPALLSALIGPAVLNQGSDGAWIAPVVATALAVLIAWRTKNMLVLIGVGMVALWVLEAVLP